MTEETLGRYYKLFERWLYRKTGERVVIQGVLAFTVFLRTTQIGKQLVRELYKEVGEADAER